MTTKKEKYLFIDNIPLIYPAVNLAKQLQIELWLGMKIVIGNETLTPITNITDNKSKEKLAYVV